MKIIAEINPVPLGRARVVGKRAYLPARSRQFRFALQLLVSQKMRGRELITAPIKITMHFYKKYRAETRGYGDLDNHVKTVLDALNGIVWTDDSLIVELHAFKHSGEPKIIIEVNQIV